MSTGPAESEWLVKLLPALPSETALKLATATPAHSTIACLAILFITALILAHSNNALGIM
jgi:hypothetical protein